ncbi:MAG: sterol desaturase family protein [Rhodospirillaceae bacterium]|nr:sterol desaturase family protein [Rhodospirillaceae bacterium]
MDYVPYAVPFFLLAILIELAYGIIKRKNTYRLNDAISSLFMGSLRSANKLIIIGIGGYVFYAIETQYALWRMDSSSPIVWAFAFVFYDFCYYWFHRISHERQIFWASHVAHHQSEDYNLSTALRQTGTGAFVTWVFYIPVFLLGVPSYVFVSVASINLIYQFWVHSEHIPKLGWYEKFFVTASNHRVHHAQNDNYIDKNYGGVFIIWDRMFGTFKEEDDNEAPIYGIRGALNTFNPIWANLHIYTNIVKDIWYAQNWKEKFLVLFARTGWKPKSLPNQPAKDEFNSQTFQKYNPEVSGKIKMYSVFQLIALAYVGLVLLESGELNYQQLWVTVSMMAFTMYCTSLWLDGKQGFTMEITRLALCVMIGVYSYFDMSLGPIAISLLGYSAINILILSLINRARLR